MSTSNDKENSKSSNRKTPGSEKAKPAKPARKRKASRAPTIEGEAVALQNEGDKKSGAPRNQKKPDENSSDVKTEAIDKTQTETIDTEKPDDTSMASDTGQFGYRALAVSSASGAAAALLLFAVVFGSTFFSSSENETNSKIKALSTRLEELSTLAKNPSGTQDNNKAIKVLEQQLEILKNRPEDARFGQIGNQIKSLENIITNLQEPAQNPDDLKLISDRLKELEAKTREIRSSMEESLHRSSLLEQAVKAADETIRGSTDGTQGSLVKQNLRLSDLEVKIKRLLAKLEDVQARLPGNSEISKLKKSTTELHQNISDLEAKSSALNGLLGQSDKARVKINTRLTRLEQLDRTDKSSRLASINFALENLQQKIISGTSFAQQLEIVAAAVPENKSLEKLKPLATSGIRSIAQLQADFPVVLKSLLAREDDPTRTGLVSKLVDAAGSLVKIRRVGEVEGDDHEAIIARLEARVKAGNLAAALAETDKITTITPVVQKWIDAVRQRMAAIELIKTIRKDVLAGFRLGNPGSAAKE